MLWAGCGGNGDDGTEVDTGDTTVGTDDDIGEPVDIDGGLTPETDDTEDADDVEEGTGATGDDDADTGEEATTTDADDTTSDDTDTTSDDADTTSEDADAGTTDGEVGEPTGNTCLDPFVIDALPFVILEDTSQATSEFHYPDDACPGEPVGWGQATKDHVYRLEIDTTGIYTIELDANFDSNLYVATDCNDIEGTCVAAAEEPGGDSEVLKLSLDAGGTYFVFVDGWSNDNPFYFGPYQLKISAACVPDCVDKNCGPDGCGGSCGECTAAQTCGAGLCADAPTECVPMGEVTCDGSAYGLSTGAPGAVNAFDGYTCGAPTELFGESLEVVYTLTLPSGDNPRVTIQGVDTEGLAVTVLQGGCVDTEATCVVQGTSSVVFDGTAGETYALVWDNEMPFVVDDFGFEVSCCVPQCGDKVCGDDGCGGECGTCDPSQWCVEGGCETLAGQCAPAQSIDCDSGTFVTSNAAAGAVDAFDNYSCQQFVSDDFSNGPEIVFELTPAEDTVVTISDDGAPVDVTVIRDLGQGCADAPAGCLANDPQEAVFEAKAGETYFVIWDSASPDNPIVESFEMTVDCCTPSGCDGSYCGDDGCGGTCGCSISEVCPADVCVPAAEGDACGTAFVADTSSFPIGVADSTAVATDAYAAKGGACPGVDDGFGVGAPDQVVWFSPPETAEYEIALSATFDSVLTVVTDCEDVALTCLGGQDLFGANQTETVALTLDAGVPVMIVIDGYAPGDSGPWALEISAPCVPDCDGKICGSNGCTGTCGDCGGGETCDQGQCFEALTSCEAKGELTCDAVTAGVTNLGEGATFAFEGYSCAAPILGPFAESTEAVYTLTPPGDSVVTISSPDDGDLEVIVLEAVDGACVDTIDSCLTASSDAATFEAAGGQTYFVIWDGGTAPTGGFAAAVDCCVPKDCDGTFCGDNCGGTCGCELGQQCDAATGTCGLLGDSCDAPLTLTPGVSTPGNNDLGFTNNHDAGGCPGSGSLDPGDNTPDVVYALEVGQSGTYEFSLPNYVPNGGPSLLWVATDCNDNLNTCVGYQDFLFDTTPLALPLAADTTYFVVVDSFGFGETGWFEVLVDGPI